MLLLLNLYRLELLSSLLCSFVPTCGMQRAFFHSFPSEISPGESFWLTCTGHIIAVAEDCLDLLLETLR